jgi:hypothetical protein
MLVPHRQHTYEPPYPVTGIGLVLYRHLTITVAQPYNPHCQFIIQCNNTGPWTLCNQTYNATSNAHTYTDDYMYFRSDRMFLSGNDCRWNVPQFTKATVSGTFSRLDDRQVNACPWRETASCCADRLPIRLTATRKVSRAELWRRYKRFAGQSVVSMFGSSWTGTSCGPGYQYGSVIVVLLRGP